VEHLILPDFSLVIGKKYHSGTFYLKGVSHEIDMGQIWYQKKDLEKLELHG